MELEQYRTRLEQMVEEKSKDLIAIQENWKQLTEGSCCLSVCCRYCNWNRIYLRL